MALALLIAVVGVSAAYATSGPWPVPTPGTGSTAVPGPSGSSGCGRPADPGPTTSDRPTGDVVQTLTVGTTTRSFRLAVPAHYRSTSPTPLILLFHGSGSDALQTSLYTQMPVTAAAAGYLVATPDAVGGNWQLSAPDAATADLSFVSDLIGDLDARYCVDRARVYAAGISLGSEFAAIVGCTASDHIAAIGLVAAEFLLKPCAGPLSVVAFHGTADPLVPYRNGGTGLSFPGVHLPGAVVNMTDWATFDGCRSVPQIRHHSSMVIRRSWPHCRSGSAVVLYTVQGGGHTWPGSPVTLPVAVYGPTTHQIDATATMLHFFARHPLDRVT